MQRFWVRPYDHRRSEVEQIKDALVAARADIAALAGPVAVHGTVGLRRIAVRWTVADPGTLGPLAALVAGVVDRIDAPMAGLRGLSITVDLDPGAPPVALPDVSVPEPPCDRWVSGVLGVEMKRCPRGRWTGDTLGSERFELFPW